MEAVPFLIAGVFSSIMTHDMVVKSPYCQPMADIVFIGMNTGAGGDELLDQGANRGLLDVIQHSDYHGGAPLDHPQNGAAFPFPGCPDPVPLSAAAARGGLFLTASGSPLCPATT